ncbi:MAG TPA: methylated-DNA--[protein]-cysteine S-methyltransferase [Thermomicrobiales bacterium]|jgi:methylated-DNA-[protein]-cysteine S-methyltransferase
MSTKRPRPATPLAHAAVPTPLGTTHLFGTARGLLTIALPNEPYAAAVTLAERLLGPVTLVEDYALLGEAAAQLAAYFAGTRQTFALTYDLHGTPFQQAVWRGSLAIPYGETRTYGALAAEIGRPGAARAVGAANAANPLAPIIPCHRLIGADGALHGHRSGLATKRWLVEHERRHRAAKADHATP